MTSPIVVLGIFTVWALLCVVGRPKLFGSDNDGDDFFWSGESGDLGGSCDNGDDGGCD